MKKPNIPQRRSKVQLQRDAAISRIKGLHEQGRYQEALDICLQIARARPEISGAWVWTDAAVSCIPLARWQDAIRYAQAALAGGGNDLAIYDVLAHVHGILGQWDEARRYGLQALDMRANRFGGEPVIPWPEPGSMPPPPSAQTRERNIIAFSLFGRDSRYCEPAILNAQEQPHVYPNWVCRFYVDRSVPESVISRIQTSGGQVALVEGAAAQWPGPMWRLLALDDPLAHRILFRDADSVISLREAAAVARWVDSGQRFHMMRDWGSHTELMLAGLWGVVAGSLPPLDALMQRFLSTPLKSRHFADQFFLRQYVWPYARASLMQHDSVFGFMDGAPFPDGSKPDASHVGHTEGSASFTAKIDLPDGTEVTWRFNRIEKRNDGQPQEELVCSYTNTARNGAVKAYIPARYERWLKQGTARVRLAVNQAT